MQNRMMNCVITGGYVSIPVLNSSAGCGVGSPFDDGQRYEMLMDAVVKGLKNPCGIYIHGDSMMPTISDGDMVIVDADTVPAWLDGRIIACNLNGEIIVKRMRQQNYSIFLYSDNINYPRIKISDTDNFNIIGVVSRMYREL